MLGCGCDRIHILLQKIFSDLTFGYRRRIRLKHNFSWTKLWILSFQFMVFLTSVFTKCKNYEEQIMCILFKVQLWNCVSIKVRNIPDWDPEKYVTDPTGYNSRNKGFSHNFCLILEGSGSLYGGKETCVFLLTSGSNFQEEFQSVSTLEDQEVPQLQPLSCLKDQLPPLSSLKDQLSPLTSCLKDQLPPLGSHSMDQFITSTSPTPEMSFFYSGVQQSHLLRIFYYFKYSRSRLRGGGAQLICGCSYSLADYSV